MRHRAVANVSGHASINLPILPFLAPRVFAPWPTLSRRAKRWQTETQRKRAGKDSTERVETKTALYSPINSPRNVRSQWERIANEDDAWSTRRFNDRTVLHDTRRVHYEGEGEPSHSPEKRHALKHWLSRNLEHRSVIRKGNAPTTEKVRVGSIKTQRTDAIRNDIRFGEHTPRWPEEANVTSTNSLVPSLLDMILQRPEEERSSYVSLAGSPECGLEEFSSTWTMGFALLNAAFDRLNPKHCRSATLVVHPRAEEVLQGGRDRSIQRWWNKLNPRFRRTIWPHVMLWLMYHSPDRALQALLATYTEPYPPPYAVMNVVDYIVSYQFGDIPKYEGTVPPEFLVALYTLLDLLGNKNIPMSQKSIYQLLVHCSPEQAITLYDTLAAKNIVINRDTLLHFAHYFGRRGDYDRALQYLHASVDAGADASSSRFKSACIEMLRESARQADGYHASSQIVSRLLQMGVELDTPLYNVLMLNAIEAGDLEVAIQIFDLIEQHQIRPNAFTYAILLKGCKSGFDSGFSEMVVESAAEMAKRTSNPYIATQVLHHVYLQHKRAMLSNESDGKRPDSQSIRTVLRTFSEFFDSKVLHKLRLLRKPVGRSKPPVISPPVPALNIVIAALLEAASHRALPPELDFDVNKAYSVFQSLVNKGDSSVVQLAESDHVYNAFLMAFGTRSETLSMCPVILKDMNEPLPPVVADTVNPLTNNLCKRVQPSTYTFNILLYSFLRHDQAAAAHKVLDLMQKRNIERDQVTWNTLISKCSYMQDVDHAVDAMRQMELRGIEMDRYTLESLSKIKDRDRLTNALKTIEDVQKRGKKSDKVDVLAPVAGQTRREEGRKQEPEENGEYFAVLPQDMYAMAG